MNHIDINCDLGEGFGVYRAAPDERIFPLISSANIACGFHAGDPQVMRQSVQLALQHAVAIGAHPGTLDLAGFGRRPVELSVVELENLLVYQVGALQAFCRLEETCIHHVKLHGWLYNAAAKDKRMAAVVAKTLKALDPSWCLYGLANSKLTKAAKEAGLLCVEEAFIDRTYQPDGTLTSRGEAVSLIMDAEVAAQQCLDLVLKRRVRTAAGVEIRVAAETLCIHGDNPAVLEILSRVHECLSQNRVEIRTWSQGTGASRVALKEPV